MHRAGRHHDSMMVSSTRQTVVKCQVDTGQTFRLKISELTVNFLQLQSAGDCLPCRINSPKIVNNTKTCTISETIFLYVSNIFFISQINLE